MMGNLLTPPFNPTTEEWIRILIDQAQTHSDAITVMAEQLEQINRRLDAIQKANEALIQMQLTNIVKH